MAYDPEKSTRQMLEYMSKIKKEAKEAEFEEQRRNFAESGQKEKSFEEHMYVDADNPCTMDNGTATIWYIIVMIVGAVFNDRLLIWIMATIIWWNHINRKKIRQKEWDKKHNGGNKS